MRTSTYSAFFIISFIILCSLSLHAQNPATFAFKLNGHVYDMEEDLVERGIQEWYDLLLASDNFVQALDSLALETGLTINQINIPDTVNFHYEIDTTATYDFIGVIELDNWYVNGSGFECDFEVTISGMGLWFGGVSEFTNGQLEVNLDSVITFQPTVLVNTGSNITCQFIAGLLQEALVGQLDQFLADLDSSFNEIGLTDFFAFLNPIAALGIEDEQLIAEALQGFPLQLDLYTTEHTENQNVQLVMEINFLTGTRDDATAFVGLEPDAVSDPHLQAGGFSFLYWVLQKGFIWHRQWTELERVQTAFQIMENNEIPGYRIEVRWDDVQKQVYLGEDLDPAAITAAQIDSILTDSEHWDTTAFNHIRSMLEIGEMKGLSPLMAFAVGHQDRLPVTAAGLRIAPATDQWSAAEGYYAVSANEYLYNLKIYALATVRHLAALIDVWQPENELNAAGFAAADSLWWRKGDLWRDAGFRNQVWQTLVEAVRTEDSGARITHDLHLLGFMQGLEDWLDDLDIVGFNYYPSSSAIPPIGFSVGEYVWAVRRALKGLNAPNKPVWLIETGYPGIYRDDPPDSILLEDDFLYYSESRQVEYIEDAFVSSVQNGASGFYYYSLVTQEDSAGSGSDWNLPLRFSGMIRRESDTEKPALPLYADLLRQWLRPTGLAGSGLIHPQTWHLSQNYPNPFNPTTTINYQLSTVSDVQLSIYNILGQKIATLVSGRQQAGTYSVQWNAAALPSGVYYYRLKAADFWNVKKMILIR